MELMHDGRPCPEYIQKILSRPSVLRARATIRRSIAAQDSEWGTPSPNIAIWRRPRGWRRRPVRLKDRPFAEIRKWKKIKETLGYLPHYHQIGRVLMEVRFPLNHPRKNFWRVVNIVTLEVHEFRRNGTPLNGTRGRLVGPLVEKRKVKR